jgi:hypothetical protein
MVLPLRTRPATKDEIAAAWQRLHDEPEPEEPKRIRTRKPSGTTAAGRAAKKIRGSRGRAR